MCRRAIALLLAAFVAASGCTLGRQEPPAGRTDSVPGELPDGVSTGPEGAGFYQAPQAPDDAKPGDLIWARPLPSPEGSEGYAVLHWTTTVDGRLVPVASVIFQPAGPSLTGPRPIMAWAHGTFGLGDRCAPSQGYFGGNGASLPVVQATVAEGLVFVATDYEGLGTAGPHPYMVNQAAGRNVLDSIRAAIHFTGAKDDTPAVVMGQSQGGSAVLLAAELQPSYAPDVRLRGSVAISVPSRLDMLDSQLSGGPYFGYVLMAIHGFQAAYPELADDDEALTEAGHAAVERISEECAGEILEEFENHSESEFGTGVVLDGPEFSRILAENDPGKVKTDVPIFVVHGDADDTIPAANSRELVQRYCTLGATVTAKFYPEAGHIDVFFDALDDIVPFVRNRLAGTPSTSDCGA
jgi:pimeloyl-ACP methyl ester carboxylesterase